MVLPRGGVWLAVGPSVCRKIRQCMRLCTTSAEDWEIEVHSITLKKSQSPFQNLLHLFNNTNKFNKAKGKFFPKSPSGDNILGKEIWIVCNSTGLRTYWLGTLLGCFQRLRTLRRGTIDQFCIKVRLLLPQTGTKTASSWAIRSHSKREV